MEYRITLYSPLITWLTFRQVCHWYNSCCRELPQWQTYSHDNIQYTPEPEKEIKKNIVKSVFGCGFYTVMFLINMLKRPHWKKCNFFIHLFVAYAVCKISYQSIHFQKVWWNQDWYYIICFWNREKTFYGFLIKFNCN